MTRVALVAAVGLAGCSAQPAEPPAAAAPHVAIAAPVAPAPGSPATAAPQPKPPEATPPVFEYPPDLAGRAVAKATVPPAPALTPVEKFGAEPRPRALPAKLLDPEFDPKVNDALPPVPFAKPAGLKPAAPPESVPLDLGRGADRVPARPTFPVAAGGTERAPDVKTPPALPTLGRPFRERVSFDDPTAELGNAAIAGPVPKVPVPPAAFLKVARPDPFELGEQVKPKVPPAAEPGLSPVPVNPRRAK